MSDATLRVLLVEDNEDDAALIIRAIKRSNGFNLEHRRVDTEEDFKHALHTVRWDFIICDYVMPNFSARRAIELVKGYRLQTPLWLLSGKITKEEAEELLLDRPQSAYFRKDDLTTFGAFFRYIVGLAKLYDKSFESWSRLLGRRDQETNEHTKRVTELTVRLCRKMGISEIEIYSIRRGAMLHDIGKMGVPDSILNKPGELDAHEMHQMRMHPVYAYEDLSADEFMLPYTDIPYCHHERWDGTGYPRGLKGDAIPLSARIFAVVDNYDALTSDRPYRGAWSKEDALHYIQAASGKMFDPAVVAAFTAMIEGEA